jgi:uracil-DNA glycosylase family 4
MQNTTGPDLFGVTPNQDPLAPEAVAEGPWEIPVNLRESRRVGGRICVAGRGPTPSDLIFVTSSVLEEETADEEVGNYGNKFKRKPSYLKGPVGMILRELCQSVGIDVDSQVYFTALAKWLLPKGDRLAPKRNHVEPGVRCLDREVREVEPKLVVAFGKAAFEFFCPVKIKFDAAVGAVFFSKEYNCRVMPMKHCFYIMAKPDWMETFRTDMRQVAELYNEIKGVVIKKVETHYRTVHNAAELRQLVSEIMAFDVYSVDCEWHGGNHVDGQLRSMQICWKDGHAAYIRFVDDAFNYVFDITYKQAGAILSLAVDRPEAKYVGHHISADLPWMHHVLGLQWRNKVRLDTEFAYQCCNEHAQLGLERHSVRFTDLGRYEMDLVMARKELKLEKDNGYGRIPDAILIPYACADVDVPMRSYPQIEAELERQGLLTYYREILNPFISNVFTQFALTGLPINLPKMEEMRELYGYAYVEMERALKRSMYTESWTLLDKVMQRVGVHPDIAQQLSMEMRVEYEDAQADSKDSWDRLVEMMQSAVPPEKRALVLPAVKHAYYAQSFNVQSKPALKVWLFDVKGYTPVKSTANKARGVPAMDWSKVMAWKPDRRAGIHPSADQQTLLILSGQNDDAVLRELLELNSVFSIKKSFLKDPIVDVGTGEVIAEAGLFAWVASDGRVHGQYSLTETSRTRAWKPNVLNWPSYVQDRITAGISRVLEIAAARGDIPPQFRKYIEGTKVPALRSCVWAPPGWCMVESDLKTAEIRGLAFISGDTNLIRIMTEPDTQFGLVKVGSAEVEIRLSFAPDCAIPNASQDPQCIMHLWVKGKLTRQVNPDELLRFPDGALRHPPADLHWSLAERVRGVPREKLLPKTDRAAAKVGNFSCLSLNARITTDVGPVAIKNLKTCNLVWDGLAWVYHEGIQYQGERYVIEYAGLRATPDHVVWAADGGKICFGDAAMRGVAISRTADAVGQPILAEFEASNGYASKAAQGLLSNGRMCLLPHGAEEVAAQPAGRALYKMPLPSQRQLHGYASNHAGGALPSYVATLPPRFARIGSQLQTTRYTRHFLEAGIYHLGHKQMARRNLQGKGLRSNRQQWALYPGEFKTRYPEGEPAQYSSIQRLIAREIRTFKNYAHRTAVHCKDITQHATDGVIAGANSATVERCRLPIREEETPSRSNSSCRTVPGAAPRYSTFPETHGGAFVERSHLQHAVSERQQSGDQHVSTVARHMRSESWIRLRRNYFQTLDQEGTNGAGCRAALEAFGFKLEKESVYDIINAGPRNRFTANGVLVSNSAYGATPLTLERKIEADTGKKPEAGTGEKILEALANRQPIADGYLKAVAMAPEAPGYLRAASGRLRHACMPSDVAGLSGNLRQSLLSAQGREFRNFGCQESVAATAAIAGERLLEFKYRCGLIGVPMIILYDSVVTLCPPNERAIWAKAHTLFLFLGNGWKYHGRVLRYPIDTELNTGWSERPSGMAARLLETPGYMPTPAHLKSVEDWLDAAIIYYEKNPEASVYNK